LQGTDHGPGPGGGCRLGTGGEKLGRQGISGHGGGRQYGAGPQAVEGGCRGYGAHIGRRAARYGHRSRRGARGAGSQGRRVAAAPGLAVKTCAPKRYPGRAEDGNMALPPKLSKPGVTHMVRISDARMSGPAFGTVVLHVAPEAMELGPLAAVQDGDIIHLDAQNGLLELDISDEEMQARIAQLRVTRKPVQPGGYLQLYIDHVMQADEGCDFDFLVGCRGADVPAHSH